MAPSTLDRQQAAQHHSSTLPLHGLQLPDWKVRALLHDGQVQCRMRPHAVINNRKVRLNTLMWLKEDWAVSRAYDRQRARDVDDWAQVTYPATATAVLAGNCLGKKDKLTVRCARNMPRWASRLDVEVVAVRHERLQSIEAEGLLLEGLRPLGDGRWNCTQRTHATALDAFIAYWNTANGGLPWENNPVVPVVSLRAHQRGQCAAYASRAA